MSTLYMCPVPHRYHKINNTLDRIVRKTTIVQNHHLLQHCVLRRATFFR